MDRDLGDSADPFTDGVEMASNNHTTSASVGLNRKAGINCDNATSRHRKGRQISKVPYIVTFALTHCKLRKFESAVS